MYYQYVQYHSCNLKHRRINHITCRKKRKKTSGVNVAMHKLAGPNKIIEEDMSRRGMSQEIDRVAKLNSGQ